MASKPIDSRPGGFDWAFYPGAPASVALSRCPASWAAAALVVNVASTPSGAVVQTGTATPHEVGDGTVTLSLELDAVVTEALGAGSFYLELLVDTLPTIVVTLLGSYTASQPRNPLAVSVNPRGQATVVEVVPTGSTGPGVPAGGAGGTALFKASGADYDTEWVGVASQAELDAHTGDGSGAHAASAIAVTPSGSIAATDVQAALVELDTEKASASSVSAIETELGANPSGSEATVAARLTAIEGAASAHIDDAADAHDATAISYAGSSGISATTVEAALDELDTEKAPLASPTFTGTPAAPTAAAGTNTTQVATTAFVQAAGAVFNVRRYGAVGNGVTDDTVAVQAAITAAADGGTVLFPVGTYLITSALTVTASADNVGSPTWQGGGIHLEGTSARRSVLKASGGIKLLDLTANLSAFCSIEKLTLLGPGSGTANSVAIDAEISPQFSLRDVYIRDFNVGVQAYDCTGWSWSNVRTSYCGTAMRLGYNCDQMNFANCDWRNSTTAVLIGWQTGSYTGASQFCGQLSFDGCIFSYSTVGIIVSDADAKGVLLDACYFEGNTKDMEVGVSGRSDGKGPQILMRGTFHSATVSPPIAIGIDIFNRPQMVLDHCSTDGTSRYTVFCKINDSNATSVVMRSCFVRAVTAALQIGSRNFNDSGEFRESFSYAGQQTEMWDWGSFPAAGPGRAHLFYNASAKTLMTWGRSTTAGVVLNQLDLVDKAGGVLVLQGTTSAFVAATSVSALPTAGASYRGCLAFVAGGTGVADLVYWCRKNAADAYEWQVLA